MRTLTPVVVYQFLYEETDITQTVCIVHEIDKHILSMFSTHIYGGNDDDYGNITNHKEYACCTWYRGWARFYEPSRWNGPENKKTFLFLHGVIMFSCDFCDFCFYSKYSLKTIMDEILLCRLLLVISLYLFFCIIRHF